MMVLVTEIVPVRRGRVGERCQGAVVVRTCPAVSQSCNLTVRSSRYIVLLRKSIPMVAWYVLSKVSYMKLWWILGIIDEIWQGRYRVIKLVFPTLWSPSNTILVRLGGVEEKSAVGGVEGESIASVDVGASGGQLSRVFIADMPSFTS